MTSLLRKVLLFQIFIFCFMSKVMADDPLGVANDFSTQSINILKGPIAKILGAVILLTGVASLLRGRHKLALSCAVAFIMLLFLPMLLTKVATG